MKGNTRPVAIVESEKTAIIASVYFPKFVWIAAGNLNGLNVEKCEVLRGRQVVLYPDLSKPQPDKPTAFEVWSRKAQELTTVANFAVNDLLERKANEAQRIEGSDLADYLKNFGYKEFIEPDPQPEKINREIVKSQTTTLQNVGITKVEDPIIELPTWSKNIAELENYFKDLTLPTGPIMLNRAARIINIPLFIKSSLETLKANNGNRTFLPCLTRLQEFKKILN